MRNIKAEWRHLPSTFGGVGLRKLLVEVVIARINLFVQHYKTPSTLGQKLTISLEALQLEVGTNVCPLLIPFQPLGLLATSCWCKSLWEGLDHYGFALDIEAEKMPLPREHDSLLSSLFVISNPRRRYYEAYNDVGSARNIFFSPTWWLLTGAR